MKKLILASVLALTTLFASISHGWSETAPQKKSYSFKFKLKTESFEYTRTAASYDEAYEDAAQVCFKHFKAGRHVSEDEGLDIIDVCANPRI